MVKCIDCAFHKGWVTNRFYGWCDPPELWRHSVANKFSLRHCLLFEPASLHVMQTATNLLMNYIALAPGVPTRMHFTDDYKVEREILEKESDKPKRIQSLVFWVDELNGEDVARTFSILSQKLAAHFEPFLANKEYSHYDFIVTQLGDGFLKDWNVQTIRRPE